MTRNKPRSRLVRAVIDTNLFVSGFLTKGGNPYTLLLALRAAVFNLVSTEALLTELTEVVQRPTLVRHFHVTAAEVSDVMLFSRRTAAIVQPPTTLPLSVRDPKDDKFLAAALAGNADYLVTGDGDLLSLRDHPALGSLKIVTVAEFL